MRFERWARPTALIVWTLLLSAASAGANGAADHAPAEEGPHGGIVAKADAAHVLELVTTAPAALLYILGEDDETIAPTIASGTIKVLVPGGAKRELPLVPRGEALRAEVDLSQTVDFRALVTVDLGGKPLTARFFQGPKKQDPGEKHGAEPTKAAGRLAGAQVSAPLSRTSAAAAITGQVIDATCLARGELPSPDHRECTIRCIKGGAPIAIVERDTNKVYVAIPAREMSASELLLPVVGLRAEFFGTVVRQGGAQFLLVEKVAAEHDHSSRYGGMVAMSGDMHVEVSALKSGEVRVYVSDEFRKPMSVARMKGRAEARVDKALVGAADLLPDRSGEFLLAKFASFQAEKVEVMIRLPLQENPDFFITFILEPMDTSTPGRAPESAAERPEATPAGLPEIRIEVKGGYKVGPGEARQGKPVRLRFVRHDSGECSREVVIPSLGIKRELAVGETLIEVTPQKAGVLRFTCGMDMMKGEIPVSK